MRQSRSAISALCEEQTAALELDEYERTTVKDLPTDLDDGAAIQRYLRGCKGCSYFKREYGKQVQLNLNAASIARRFFRGIKKRSVKSVLGDYDASVLLALRARARAAHHAHS